MKTGLYFLFFLLPFYLSAQSLYFPPTSGDEWATIEPAELGWCTDQIPPLLEFLEENNTKAFIVLKDGKIVIEAYFDDTQMDTYLPWNSAGKTITALMTGIAQENGLLDINDPTSTYLGSGWTSLAPEQEDSITIWHQLTMTSGLDDSEPYCTDPECLEYLAAPGSRWAYHNGPYTLLADVIEAASGLTMNNYVLQNLKSPTGIDGAFIPLGYNKVFFGSARGMARMGLLVLNNGNWDGTSVLSDADYFEQMTQLSQSLNESYGYLWWLNGADAHMLPATQFVFAGPIAPDAPQDLIAGIGKDGQYLNVVPGKDLVVIRMGSAPNDNLVPTTFHNDMWAMLGPVICEVTPANEINNNQKLETYPNPVNEVLYIDSEIFIAHVRIFDLKGNLYSPGSPRLPAGYGTTSILVDHLSAGLYLVEITDSWGERYYKKIVKL